MDFACGPGCSTCCTRSVPLTTAEGRLILEYLREGGRDLPPLPFDPLPVRPSLTVNDLAHHYLAGRDPAGESDSPWLFEPCFFLCNGLCSIYEARPFACRSFGSTCNCATGGAAEVPDWYLTLATVINQVLEDLDRGGRWAIWPMSWPSLRVRRMEMIKPPGVCWSIDPHRAFSCCLKNVGGYLASLKGSVGRAWFNRMREMFKIIENIGNYR